MAMRLIPGMVVAATCLALVNAQAGHDHSSHEHGDAKCQKTKMHDDEADARECAESLGFTKDSAHQMGDKWMSGAKDAAMADSGTTHTVSWGYDVSKASIEIAVGDSVRWVLEQGGGHDIVSGAKWGEPDAKFKSPFLSKKNEEWTYRFTTAGSYPYYCTPHSSMVATITVKSGGDNSSHEHGGAKLCEETKMYDDEAHARDCAEYDGFTKDSAHQMGDKWMSGAKGEAMAPVRANAHNVCSQPKLRGFLSAMNDDAAKATCAKFMGGDQNQECPCYTTVSKADAEANYKCLYLTSSEKTLYQDWERCTMTGTSLAPIVTIPEDTTGGDAPTTTRANPTSVCDQSKLRQGLSAMKDSPAKATCTEFMDGDQTKECPCYTTVSKADAEANYKCFFTTESDKTLYQDWERCDLATKKDALKAAQDKYDAAEKSMTPEQKKTEEAKIAALQAAVDTASGNSGAKTTSVATGLAVAAAIFTVCVV